MIRQSILLVEDDEDIRELVSYNLLKEGYQVAGVSSGEEALAAVDNTVGVGSTFILRLPLDLPAPGG